MPFLKSRWPALERSVYIRAGEYSQSKRTEQITVHSTFRFDVDSSGDIINTST